MAGAPGKGLTGGLDREDMHPPGNPASSRNGGWGYCSRPVQGQHCSQRPAKGQQLRARLRRFEFQFCHLIAVIP